MNKVCSGAASNYVTAQFTTAPLPCTAPSGLTSSYSNNVTTFSWNLVPGAIEYYLQIKYPGYDWTQIEYETIVPVNTLDLTGIIQSGTFDWRVSATCTTGTSGYTESQTTVPCPAPSGLFTNNITGTSATVNWIPAPGLNTNISNFYVSYRMANTSNAWISAGYTFGSSKNITGLSPGTTYEWAVILTCPYFNSTALVSQFTTVNTNACATPSGLTVTGIGNTSATFSWSAVSGASYQLQYKPVSSSGWNGVTLTGTSYSLTNLSVGTAYEFRVRSKCGNNYSNYSASTTFSTLNCVSYGVNTSEWIDLFKLGTINRVSGAETGGYKNTGLSTDLRIGSSFSGQISAGFNGSVRQQNYCVYIDFNRNGNFELSERVYGAGNISNSGTCNFSVSIPATATPGPTGMRVVLRRAADGPVTPCLTGFLGETEDYSVNLVTTTSLRSDNNSSNTVTATDDKIQTSVTVSPNPAEGLFTVSLPGNAAHVSYEVISMNGSVLQKNVITKNIFSIDITKQPKGLYLLRITDQSGRQQTIKLFKN